MSILILPPRHSLDADAIRSAAIDAGWIIEQFTSWRAPDWLRGSDLVLYGEPLFADVVTPTLGIALLEPTPNWLVTLDPSYLKRDVRLMSLNEAKRYPTRAFIKPAEDKSFPAAVYANGTELPESAQILPDLTPVLVSEPVHWESEFRCFVLDRTVTTISLYLRNGELTRTDDNRWPITSSEQKDAIDYIEGILKDPAVRLPAAIVIDVGEMAGRGWAIVEANAAWGSGIYGCDATSILPVLARASIPRDMISLNDQEWIRKEYEIDSPD